MYITMKSKWITISKGIKKSSPKELQHFLKQARLDIDTCKMQMKANAPMPNGIDCEHYRYKKLLQQIIETKKAIKQKLFSFQSDMFHRGNSFGLS